MPNSAVRPPIWAGVNPCSVPATTSTSSTPGHDEVAERVQERRRAQERVAPEEAEALGDLRSQPRRRRGVACLLERRPHREQRHDRAGVGAGVGKERHGAAEAEQDAAERRAADPHDRAPRLLHAGRCLAAGRRARPSAGLPPVPPRRTRSRPPRARRRRRSRRAAGCRRPRPDRASRLRRPAPRRRRSSACAGSSGRLPRLPAARRPPLRPAPRTRRAPRRPPSRRARARAAGRRASSSPTRPQTAAAPPGAGRSRGSGGAAARAHLRFAGGSPRGGRFDLAGPRGRASRKSGLPAALLP